MFSFLTTEEVWNKLLFKKLNYNYILPNKYIKFDRQLDPVTNGYKYVMGEVIVDEVRKEHLTIKHGSRNPSYIAGVLDYGEAWFLMRII